jgi:hypothetical protein
LFPRRMIIVGVWTQVLIEVKVAHTFLERHFITLRQVFENLQLTTPSFHSCHFTLVVFVILVGLTNSVDIEEKAYFLRIILILQCKMHQMSTGRDTLDAFKLRANFPLLIIDAKLHLGWCIQQE